MSQKPLSFGVFTDFGPADWDGEKMGKNEPWDGRFYTDIATILEGGNYDFLFLADGLAVADTYGGSFEAPLHYGFTAPLHDPAPLAAVVGSSTKNIGVVITMSTLAYHPYTVARLSSTLDHICGGRFGWNIVTSTETGAAQNYGMDDLPPRNVRYEMADDYMGAFDSLLNSWEPDAVVMDRETGKFADGKKVHKVDYRGPYFQTMGPLNVCPSPQGRPLCFQAGSSPAGMAFAAKHADAIISGASSIEGMKAMVAGMKEKRQAAGHEPDSLKVFFLMQVIIAETTEKAKEKQQEIRKLDRAAARPAILGSMMSNIDLSQFEMDEPVPDLETQGGSGTLKSILGAAGPGATMREALTASGSGGAVELVGSADDIADYLARITSEVQPDGFLFVPPMQLMTREFAHQMAEQLAPALQKRGIMSVEPKEGTLKQKFGLTK